MCKYGMLKRKDPMKDELAYVDNPVESGFPGHWLPLSILKKMMEMRVQTPAEFTENKVLTLKLLISKKHIKTSPYVEDITSTVKITPTTTDKVIEPQPKALIIKSQIPSQESFSHFTKKALKRPVTLSSTAMTKDKFKTDASQLSSAFTKLITVPKTIQKSTYTYQSPSELSTLISEPKTIHSAIIEQETTDVPGKTIMESNAAIKSQLTTTTEVFINTKITDAKPTSIILPETSPELQRQNLTTMKITPSLPTKITTELITSSSEKSTAVPKTVTIALLTEGPTTELTTESVTKETIKELTKEVKETTQLQEILTTVITTTTTTTETGNPFY